MQCNVDVNKLRPGVRYTINHIHGYIFRGDFIRYLSKYGVEREAVVFESLDKITQAPFHMPISFIRDIKVYVVQQVKQ